MQVPQLGKLSASNTVGSTNFPPPPTVRAAEREKLGSPASLFISLHLKTLAFWLLQFLSKFCSQHTCDGLPLKYLGDSGLWTKFTCWAFTTEWMPRVAFRRQSDYLWTLNSFMMNFIRAIGVGLLSLWNDEGQRHMCLCSSVFHCGKAPARRMWHRWKSTVSVWNVRFQARLLEMQFADSDLRRNLGGLGFPIFLLHAAIFLAWLGHTWGNWSGRCLPSPLFSVATVIFPTKHLQNLKVVYFATRCGLQLLNKWTVGLIVFWILFFCNRGNGYLQTSPKKKYKPQIICWFVPKNWHQRKKTIHKSFAGLFKKDWPFPGTTSKNTKEIMQSADHFLVLDVACQWTGNAKTPMLKWLVAVGGLSCASAVKLEIGGLWACVFLTF